MRILITGSRDWDNARSIQHRILEAISDWIDAHPGLRKDQPLGWVTVVHGECPTGADKIADIFATKSLKCKVERYPADWRTFGRRAGFVRNSRMVNTAPDICLAFIRNKSKGTTGCRDLATKAGIPTESFYYENECEQFPFTQN